MIKNRKILALICAISMIATVFSAFTVVSADEITRGFQFTNMETSEDGKTVDVDIEYVGYDNGLSGVTIFIDMPENVTDVKTVATDAFSNAQYNFADGTYSFAFGAIRNVTDDDCKIATLTLTFSEAVTGSETLSFADGTEASAMNADETDYEYIDTVTDSSMDAATVTIPTYVDPSATVAPTPMAERGEYIEADSDDDSDLDPIVKVTRGFAFDNVVVDGTTVTVDLIYVGYDNGLSGAAIFIDMPENVTDVKTAATDAFSNAQYNFADGTYSFAFAATRNVTDDDCKIATLTLTLSEELASAFQIKLADGTEAAAMNADETDYEYIDAVADESMPRANVTISASDTSSDIEPPTDKIGSVDLDELLDADEANDTVDEDVSNYYIVVSVTDEDGEDAVYGTDYVAVFDGTVLTEREYNNLINGYFDEFEDVTSIADVINGLTFNTYTDNLTIKAQLVNENNEVVSSGEATISEDNGTTINTKDPSITLTVSPTTVYVGDKVTVTATVKNPKDDGEVSIYTDDDSLDHMTASGLKPGTSTTQKGTATFTAALKGNVTIYAVYFYDYDENGDPQGVSKIAEKDITIKTESSSSSNSSGSGSSSNSSGSGDVASGNYSNNATINYTASFSDLDDVSWAQEAIYGLASKNVISGYEDGTFRPNNNITRAEFAKLLVLTFGYGSFTGASANFSDVPTTHWAYDYVAIAYTLGAITGYDADTFGPDDNITREQMATMIYRLVTNYDVTLTLVEDAITFDDDWAISDYAREAVTKLQQADVINGMGDGTFAPQDSATRAQAAVMLYKFVN